MVPKPDYGSELWVIRKRKTRNNNQLSGGK